MQREGEWELRDALARLFLSALNAWGRLYGLSGFEPGSSGPRRLRWSGWAADRVVGFGRWLASLRGEPRLPMDAARWAPTDPRPSSGCRCGAQDAFDHAPGCTRAGEGS